ncbi:MAG TPA: acyl-ACP--UDP-N-acetylglucosamine O-acyltransferase [Calditrichaeota bacterium]|nr:acyl-ACP--UDP-N-acetylglucosamine O-acyltransferase [Calditrichota bacterium]
MTRIHPTAIINKDAQLGEGVVVGPYSVIEDDVLIGDQTEIAYHAVIASGSRIGKNCRIFSSAVIGTRPQDLKFGEEKTFVEIGDNTTVREFATINRATTHSYTTNIGSNCLIMAYAHVAHDCKIGNNVVIANAVNMGGHVIIGDYVGVGGLAAIHQFVHIGCHSFIGGASKVKKDVPPYILAMGEPLTFAGLNKIGLQRRGFDNETLRSLRRAYKVIYKENLTITEAIANIEENFEPTPEIQHLIEFLRGSERGLIR